MAQKSLHDFLNDINIKDIYNNVLPTKKYKYNILFKNNDNIKVFDLESQIFTGNITIKDNFNNLKFYIQPKNPFLDISSFKYGYLDYQFSFIKSIKVFEFFNYITTDFVYVIQQNNEYTILPNKELNKINFNNKFNNNILKLFSFAYDFTNEVKTFLNN